MVMTFCNCSVSFFSVSKISFSIVHDVAPAQLACFGTQHTQILWYSKLLCTIACADPLLMLTHDNIICWSSLIKTPIMGVIVLCVDSLCLLHTVSTSNSRFPQVWLPLPTDSTLLHIFSKIKSLNRAAICLTSLLTITWISNAMLYTAIYSSSHVQASCQMSAASYCFYHVILKLLLLSDLPLYITKLFIFFFKLED